MIQGHGLRTRQVRGPLGTDEPPGIITLKVRRYRCTRCGAVITVVPAGLCRGRHYGASAIGLAFAHYGLSHATLAQVREKVCPWKIRSEQSTGWPTLRRWARAVELRTLFPSVRAAPAHWALRERSARIATTLMAEAPALVRGASPIEQVFAGAAQAA